MMARKILITDSDWNLLSLAYRTLSEQGYELIDEAAPNTALSIANNWRPDIIIAPPQCITEWQELSSEAANFPAGRILVTFSENDDPSDWQSWISAGHSILIKPIEHPSQLIAAIEDAAGTIAADRSRAV